MPYDVYAFGSNSSGQLGLGHLEDVPVPTKCVLSEEWFEHRPSAIAAGGNHTLILCEDGRVFGCGTNADGRCGLDARDEPCTHFEQVVSIGADNRVIDRFSFISATWEASTFVTLDDQVYTAGTGRKGELGQGLNVVQSSHPKLVANFPPANTKIVDLAACMSHTIAVLSNGEVYGWGGGRKGQLGEPATDAHIPRRIIGLQFHAVRAVCGRDFSYLISSADSGVHTVLGSDKWKIKSSAPELSTPWKNITANWSSLHVLLADGRLISWGRNDHCQLPQTGMGSLESVFAGSEHLIAESGDGRILAWGWGEHGNCGLPVRSNGDADGGGNQILDDSSFHPLGAGCATSWLFQYRH